ncbi:MAG: transposase [Actinomycetota bacterium]|nr:transposase [Actinomycetota bacterium]
MAAPLVDDPRRVVRVRALGVDEHGFLSATPEHPTIYATILVDLDRRKVIHLFKGKSTATLRRWLSERSGRWREAVKVVALELTDTHRSGLDLDDGQAIEGLLQQSQGHVALLHDGSTYAE